MTITRDMDRITRTVGEMTEAQARSYEVLADNFAAFQRRSADVARDGLEFLKLQESNARAAREWWTNAVKLVRLQQRNARFAQSWLTSGIGALREQADHNLRTTEAFAESARRQQEGFQRLTKEWAGAYRDFFSPFAYAQEGLKTAQRATQQGLQLAGDAAEQTEQSIQQAEQVIREAELRAAVLDAVGAEDYDELTVGEISDKLAGLSAGELEQVREYEKQNKNRETLVELLDRKIRTTP